MTITSTRKLDKIGNWGFPLDNFTVSTIQSNVVFSSWSTTVSASCTIKVVDGHGDQAVTRHMVPSRTLERASQYKARVGTTTLFESCPSSSTVALEYCGLKRGATLKKANAHTTVLVRTPIRSKINFPEQYIRRQQKSYRHRCWCSSLPHMLRSNCI
jgi:hypothetical protein